MRAVDFVKTKVETDKQGYIIVFNAVMENEKLFEEKFGEYIDVEKETFDIEGLKTAWTELWAEWWQKQSDEGKLD